MKIVLAQQNYHIGNFEQNTAKIIEAIQAAKTQQADLIVFSELSVCGYPPRDFLEFNDFIQRCQSAIDEIKQHTDTIGVLIGCPSYNKVPEGKDLFNSAYLLYQQEVQDIVHKTLEFGKYHSLLIRYKIRLLGYLKNSVFILKRIVGAVPKEIVGPFQMGLCAVPKAIIVHLL